MDRAHLTTSGKTIIISRESSATPAKRIFDQLKENPRFPGGYTIVKDYERLKRSGQREMLVPLEHPPGCGGRWNAGVRSRPKNLAAFKHWLISGSRSHAGPVISHSRSLRVLTAGRFGHGKRKGLQTNLTFANRAAYFRLGC